jgi:hypothetical protein
MASALRKLVGGAVGLAITAASLTTVSPASADYPVNGKGIVGGGLLGAEVGMFTLSAAGARDTWLYFVVPGALAAGGAVGGYFVETKADPKVSMFFLTGGMALAIPAVVATLSATAYRPASEDSTPADAKPAASPAAPPAPAGPTGQSAHTISRSVRLPRALPTALVNFSDRPMELAVPAVKIAPMYSVEELAKFGGSQRYEVSAPVVAIAF